MVLKEKIKSFFTSLKSANTLIAVSAILYFAVSIPGLYVDVINPDSINWHVRSNSFVNGLLSGDFDKTYQTYHPGVTLMWLTGPVLKAVDGYYVSKGFQSYDRSLFLNLDFAAKITLVTSATILFIVALDLLKNIVSKKFLILFSTLMIFEPYFLGQRRLYHLDYLMASLLLVSFISFFKYFYHSHSRKYFVLGVGMFTAAILTKTTALILLPIPLIMLLAGKIKLKEKALHFFVFLVLLAVFVFIMFPALWRNPAWAVPYYYQKLSIGVYTIGYEGKKDVGTGGELENSITEKVFGQRPVEYYLKVLLFDLTPVAVFLLLISVVYLTVFSASAFVRYLVSKLKKDSDEVTICKENILSVWMPLLAFAVGAGFIIALTLSNKKIDRYAAVCLPFIFIIISYALSKFNKTAFIILLFAYLLSIVPAYSRYYPYFYSYSNPFMGGLEGRFKRVNADTFGVGAYDVFRAIHSDVLVSDFKGQEPIITSQKSVQAIATDVRFTREPNCFTNYYVAFAYGTQPTTFCRGGENRFQIIHTVKVGGMDYWYIYKNVDPYENLLYRYYNHR